MDDKVTEISPVNDSNEDADLLGMRYVLRELLARVKETLECFDGGDPVVIGLIDELGDGTPESIRNFPIA